ncbi:LIC_10190 family membrane protein [Candidatus Pelagibacter sp. HIMB1542]|uniref:LIC_10190 family membrane protein n=1 Tax=Candidatus Pelagibacter sp. HIMB1542 TaxID=3413346 RepID=UPI003F82F8F5
MIIPVFSLLIILFFLYNVSFIIINKISKNFNITLKIDYSILIIGIYFIIFMSFIWHLIFPLKFFFIFLVLILIVYQKKKLNFIDNFKKIEINFISIISIVIIIFISLSNSPIYDTMLYHHQVLNWFSDFAISKNLIQIDMRLGMVSPWHMFLSLFNLKINNYNLSFAANLIPFILLTLIFFQTVKKKFILLSDLYLINCYFFIIIFSLIHPFGNGILLMELGSIGTDFNAAIFFILSVYFFLKYYDSKNNNDRNVFFLYLIITCSLTVFSRISYMPIFILTLPILLKSFNKQHISLIIIFAFLPFSLFIFKNILTSNCLIFPIYQTCDLINFDFSKELVRKYYEIIISFQRSSPDHEFFGNYEITNYSLSWFKPWFFNFFLRTSIFQICYFVIILCLLIILFDKFSKKIFKIDFNILYIFLILFLFSNILWLIAPDVRFSYGFIISFSMFLISVILINFYDLFKSSIKNIIIISLFLLSIKNYSNFEYFLKLNKSNFYDYSSLVLINKDDDLKIFESNHKDKFCYDIKNICVGSDKVNFKIYNEFLFNKAIRKIND